MHFILIDATSKNTPLFQRPDPGGETTSIIEPCLIVNVLKLRWSSIGRQRVYAKNDKACRTLHKKGKGEMRKSLLSCLMSRTSKNDLGSDASVAPLATPKFDAN